jgi:tRNA uridine 5-carboxymethylaminomethyl modification enzyme
VNGFSTSLPEDIQFKALRSVDLKCKFRPGYAIEYDFPPTIKTYFETKLVEGLYFADRLMVLVMKKQLQD